ncbi:hypothetical protein [Vibrio quintilis]|uniref:Transglycosylase SLT domain-containing protein n=1 Tax=Vibrio quintilis TaxID=1117707 RepID=A0A1M7YU23_9VIBR|nr:hypothetical protein [Vibrio quintilis]SHO56150.1 hypothetical protein VQ7734_01917 [Vibrio quintilis]
MNATQLTELVVRPELERLGLYSKAAEQLIVGTIFTESHGEYLKQLGDGPALGIAQMEPATHNDIWSNFLKYSNLSDRIMESVAPFSVTDDADVPVKATELIGNMCYAVAMCRAHYYRKSEPLPKAGDVEGFARYWKTHYNTAHGAGHMTDFIDKFPREILSL